jgi:hypothetical protein
MSPEPRAVSGDVWEYFNETEIAMFFPEAITVHPFSHPLPAAYSLATAAIDTSEEWEGVLVLAANAAVKDPDVGFGEWLISNGGDADTCRVGDDGNYTYEPVLGDSVTVRGIVKYAYKKYTLEPRDECDICRPSQAGIEDRAVPSRIMLSVAPNPIAGGGVVRFALPVSGRVGLKVYNVQGELVKTLLDKRMEAGTYRVDWKSTSSQGDRVTSGIYFFRLETPNGSLVSKVVVSR